MAKKKKKKKKKSRSRSWEEIRGELPVDDRRVAAYERLMDAETRLYELWERHGTAMNWIGEALSFPIEDEGMLWVASLGEKVASLGGHLEVVAVFPDETVTLMREPGAAGASEDEESR